MEHIPLGPIIAGDRALGLPLPLPLLALPLALFLLLLLTRRAKEAPESMGMTFLESSTLETRVANQYMTRPNLLWSNTRMDRLGVLY